MNSFTRKLDQFVLHPVAGPIIFLGILSSLFQAVFSWSGIFMDAIEQGAAWLGGTAGEVIPAG